MAEEIIETPEIVVEEVPTPKAGTVVDPEPDNSKGEVVVYEADGSWHKENKETK